MAWLTVLNSNWGQKIFYCFSLILQFWRQRTLSMWIKFIIIKILIPWTNFTFFIDWGLFLNKINYGLILWEMTLLLKEVIAEFVWLFKKIHHIFGDLYLFIPFTFFNEIKLLISDSCIEWLCFGNINFYSNIIGIFLTIQPYWPPKRI